MCQCQLKRHLAALVFLEIKSENLSKFRSFGSNMPDRLQVMFLNDQTSMWLLSGEELPQHSSSNLGQATF